MTRISNDKTGVNTISSLPLLNPECIRSLFRALNGGIWKHRLKCKGKLSKGYKIIRFSSLQNFVILKNKINFLFSTPWISVVECRTFGPGSDVCLRHREYPWSSVGRSARDQTFDMDLPAIHAPGPRLPNLAEVGITGPQWRPSAVIRIDRMQKTKFGDNSWRGSKYACNVTCFNR
jgi:hypothetical protein